MASLFAKPYSMVASGISAWRNAFGFGVFVFLFLALFRPFGIGDLGQRLWLVAFGFGVVCTGCMLLANGLLPKLAPAYFSEPGWTVGREIGWTLVNLVLIGVANAFYSHAIGWVDLNAGTFVQYGGYTVLVCILPVCAGVLLNEARQSKRYRAGSEELNARLAERVLEEVHAAGTSMLGDNNRITIPSESGREDFTLAPGDLLFIRSSSNYMEVYFLQGLQVQRKVLRGSLKAVEARLANHKRMLRCHKSHLVNLDHVVKVNGNAQGYRLGLDHGEEAVPVSRSLNHRLAGLVTGYP